MMGVIVEVRETNMWFIFKTQKQKERERESEAKDREIEAIKAETAQRSIDATDEIKKLNDLVEKHGNSGLIYFSTGKKKK